MKSPLRYPGGKSRAVGRIMNLLPDFSEYREPFIGGGSVFFGLAAAFPQKKYWINDLYPELYNCWLQTRDDIGGVTSQIRAWRDNFTEGKQLHGFLSENMSAFNSVEKAAAFFIFNRITFSGTTESGGYSEQAFRGRFTESSVERLAAASAALQGVNITNLDYADVTLAPGNDTVIFLDPPYFSAEKSRLYGKNGSMHAGFDHQRFADTMRHCPHKWLVTYDDSPYIRDIFSFARIFAWDLTYGMRNVAKQGDQTGRELFISNYLESLEPAQYQPTAQPVQSALF